MFFTDVWGCATIVWRTHREPPLGRFGDDWQRPATGATSARVNRDRLGVVFPGVSYSAGKSGSAASA